VETISGDRWNLTGDEQPLSAKLTLRREGTAPEQGTHPLLRHSVFAWLGIRPVLGQHTAAEHEALIKWASGRSILVEIGVAEGASAVALRGAMSPSGTLVLIDPFHLSRIRAINTTRRAAHRAVRGCRNGRVRWIEEFSSVAANNWKGPIDFLFIDGDHSETGVGQDWDRWHRHVAPSGIVAFHDAATFPGGWTREEWGPVRLVNRLFRERALPGWRIVQQVDSLVVIERLSTNLEI
jgi:predicted O-methyltransferase YrrM